MSEAFVIGGVRTPVGRYGGALAGVRPDDLAALVVREAVERAGVPVDAVDEALLDGITREECDAWALRSQERAALAQEKGFFDAELVAVPVPRGEPVTRDETPRPGTTSEGLARLKPSFREGGVVTAGNASPLS